MKKIDDSLQKNDTKHVEDTKNNRRTFLKKAAYSAPVLLVLGQLSKPTKAQADSGDPDGPPDWGGF